MSKLIWSSLCCRIPPPPPQKKNRDINISTYQWNKLKQILHNTLLSVHCHITSIIDYCNLNYNVSNLVGKNPTHLICMFKQTLLQCSNVTMLNVLRLSNLASNNTSGGQELTL